MADDIQQLLVALGVNTENFDTKINQSVDKGIQSIQRMKQPAARAGSEAGKSFGQEFGKEMTFLTGILRKYFGEFGMIAADALENFKRFSDTSVGKKTITSGEQKGTEAVAGGITGPVGVAVAQSSAKEAEQIASIKRASNKLEKIGLTLSQEKLSVEKQLRKELEYRQSELAKYRWKNPELPMPRSEREINIVKSQLVDLQPVTPIQKGADYKIQKISGKDVVTPQKIDLNNLEQAKIKLGGVAVANEAVAASSTKAGGAVNFLKNGFVSLASTIGSMLIIGVVIGAIFKLSGAMWEWHKQVKELNKETGLAKETISSLMLSSRQYGTQNELASTLTKLVKLLKEVALGSEEAKKKLKGLKIEITGDVDKDLDAAIKDIQNTEDRIEQLSKIRALGMTVKEFNAFAASKLEQPKIYLGGSPATSQPLSGYVPPKNVDIPEPTIEEQRLTSLADNLKQRRELLDEIGVDELFDNLPLKERLALLESQYKMLVETATYNQKDEDDLHKKILTNKNERQNIEKQIASDVEKANAEQERWLEKRKALTEQIYNLEANMVDLRNQANDRNKWGVDQLIGNDGQWLVRPMTRQGEQNIRAAWDVKNSEAWARTYTLNGRPDLAEKAQNYADNLRKQMGFLTSQEQDPLGAVRDNTRKTAEEIAKLKEELLKGNIIATGKNG